MRHPRPRRALALAGAMLLVATGCSTLLWETGLPWTQAGFEVTRVDRRAHFLDVEVKSDGLTRRYFARATDTCEAMLQVGATVEVGHSGGPGPFESGDEECPIVGIGELEKLRGSRSRAGYGTGPIIRGIDRIEIVHRDEEYLYARGGFSIGAMFGWTPGTDQVVALLPISPECAPLADGGPVDVIFKDAGTPALGIVAGEDVCPVRGLIAVRPDDFSSTASR